MKVSLNWLGQYVDVPTDTKAFCDRLDLTGTGVEAVEVTGDAFKHIVTAQIISKKAHPDSDHMWVTLVDVGEANLNKEGNPEPLQIVCGAQNFEEGDHVVTAMIGAVLPGDFKIKKSKLRGVASCGMNCSKRELGLGEEHDGIIVLPNDAPIGVPFAEYAGLSDTILDLEITPDRPDCLSMVGMAREVGAMYQTPVTLPIYELEEDDTLENIEDLATVEIEDPSRCARYSVKVIKDVKVGPSPDWLAERVTAAGARSINNIVDITNYILYLYGQPLHAFDFDKIKSEDGMAHVIVRPAKENEPFTTLDEKARKLSPDMTVIANPEGPIALAGVMGGLDSEITDETTTVLLETATFDRAHTSRTSRNLGLISEASLRYERTVDDNPIADYADAAAALFAEVAQGRVCPGLIDVWTTKTEPTQLEFRIKRYCSMMGIEMNKEDIVDLLERLDCEVSDTDDKDVLQVIPPTNRPDLAREIDLYEEILRLWGMDRVEPTLPASPGRVGHLTETQKIERIINRSMCASGLNETVTYSFAAADDIERLRMSPEGLGKAVELLNPMNADQPVMRQSIIPGLVKSVAYNQSHGVKNIQLYELGKVFYAHDGKKQPTEREKLAGVLAGAMQDAAWNVAHIPFDFFDGKGVIENLARELAIPKLRFTAAKADELPHLQPGRAAMIHSKGRELGWIGEIHPLAVDAFEATGPIVAFELDIPALMAAARPSRDYIDVPTFPSVIKDIAFVVDESVTDEVLVQRITSAGGKLLSGVHLFDVYRDEEHLGAGKKSMAYTLTFRAADRTLKTEEVDKAMNRLIKKVCGAVNAEVRA